ncbi:MAG: polysaccharide biosynthesis C-terminal domain-containing protein, partial [Candidatus Glassbacteria bacterium]
AGGVESRTALFCLFAAYGAAVLFNSWFLARSLPEEARSAEPVYRRREWVAVGAGMLFVSGQYLIFNRVDIMMLEPMAGKAAAGVYSAAVRLAWLVSFFVQAVSVIAAPLIAELHAGNRRLELERMVHLTVNVSSACSAAAFAALVVGGKFALGVFGPEFTTGYHALVILCAAQFFNAVTGPSGFLLTMTGHERLLGGLLSVALALNALLNFILIPQYGMEGAAAATGISTIFWNALAAVLIHRKLGIIPVIGLSGRGRHGQE